MRYNHHGALERSSQKTDCQRVPQEEPQTRTNQGPVLTRYATPPSPKGWRAQVKMDQYHPSSTHTKLTPIRQEPRLQDQARETNPRTRLETRRDLTRESQVMVSSTRTRRERAARSSAGTRPPPPKEGDPGDR